MSRMVHLHQNNTSFQNINAVCASSPARSLRPLPALQCPGSTSWLLGLSWNNEDDLTTHHPPPLHLAYTSGQSSPHQLLPPLTTPTAVYLNRHSIILQTILESCHRLLQILKEKHLPFSLSCRAPPESPCPCLPPIAHKWKSLENCIQLITWNP